MEPTYVREAVSLASSDRFQAPQWQSTPCKRQHIEFDSGVNFSAVMIEMSRALCVHVTIFNKALESNPFVSRCVVEIFLKGKFFSEKTLFHRPPGERVQTCLMHSRKVFFIKYKFRWDSIALCQSKGLLLCHRFLGRVCLLHFPFQASPLFSSLSLHTHPIIFPNTSHSIC